MEVLDLISKIAKLPFFYFFKAIFLILNIFPSWVYELYSPKGYNKKNKPHLREVFTLNRGRRKLRFGHYLVALFSGKIIKAPLSTKRKYCRGIYTEDYDRIQEKWGI